MCARGIRRCKETLPSPTHSVCDSLEVILPWQASSGCQGTSMQPSLWGSHHVLRREPSGLKKKYSPGEKLSPPLPSWQKQDAHFPCERTSCPGNHRPWHQTRAPTATQTKPRSLAARFIRLRPAQASQQARGTLRINWLLKARPGVF